MSDHASGGGDDLSGLSGFFFYVFLVHPATAWILKPGRFEKRKSIMYAIAFLAGLAAIKTGKRSMRQEMIVKYYLGSYSVDTAASFSYSKHHQQAHPSWSPPLPRVTVSPVRLSPASKLC
jgi:hypothetical protein